MDIEKLRLNINIIDDKIIKLLEDRTELVKIIGKEKKCKNINILCQSREDKIIKRLQENTNLDNLLIKRIWSK